MSQLQTFVKYAASYQWKIKISCRNVKNKIDYYTKILRRKYMLAPSFEIILLHDTRNFSPSPTILSISFPCFCFSFLFPATFITFLWTVDWTYGCWFHFALKGFVTLKVWHSKRMLKRGEGGGGMESWFVYFQPERQRACVCVWKEAAYRWCGWHTAEFSYVVLVYIALHTFPFAVLCMCVSTTAFLFCLFSAYSASERTGCVWDRCFWLLMFVVLCAAISQNFANNHPTNGAATDIHLASWARAKLWQLCELPDCDCDSCDRAL